MRRIILTVLLALSAAACSSDENDAGFEGGVDGPDTPIVDSDDEQPLQDAAGADDDLINSIEAYARTQIQGDSQAALQARSEGCAVVDTDNETARADGGNGDEVAVSDVDADVDGNEAVVSYRLDPGGQQISDERWVREDGEWKWDNC